MIVAFRARPPKGFFGQPHGSTSPLLFVVTINLISPEIKRVVEKTTIINRKIIFFISFYRI